MNRKKTLFSLILLAILALPLLALPVKAGGWATVDITSMPEELYAGRPFTIEFMVRQHRNKPVHELYWDNNQRIPVEPLVSLGSAGAGEKLTFNALPLKQPGLFVAEITLPGEGEWSFAIDPNPLGGINEFKPLTVLPQSAAPTAPAIQSFSPLLDNTTAIYSFTAVFLLAMSILAYRTYQGRQAG